MRDKVVLLGPYPPPYGGVSVYISTLFDFVKNEGVELWTYAGRKIEGPDIFFMNSRAGLPALVMRRGRGARIADNTHFLVEYPSLLVPGWIGLKKVLGFEWIKIIHDGSLPARFSGLSKFRRALFRLSIAHVSKFVVVSKELERWLRDEIAATQEIVVIKSLLPIKEMAALSHITAGGLSSYLESQKRVCSIGAFIPEYGFDQVANAVEQLRRTTGENIGLALLDGAFASDDDFRKQVLRDRDWITVLQDVPHPEVQEILRRSDVFVRAFQFESYGLSRIEAIWAGTPVIATNAGETRGMLTFDFGDREKLVSHLKAVLSGPPDAHLSVWAERYSKEAEDNLNSIRKILGLSDSAREDRAEVPV
jgi:glycogen synthase